MVEFRSPDAAVEIVVSVRIIARSAINRWLNSTAGCTTNRVMLVFGDVHAKGMHMLGLYAVALGGIVLGQLAPGPNMLAVIAAAIGQGRRQAIIMAAGVATVTLVWAVAAALGISALLAIFPALMATMKLLGGGYLLFLAAKAFLGARRSGAIAIRTEVGQWSVAEAWRRGVLVNLANPKSALMWGAVTTFFLGSGLSTFQVLAFGPIGAMSAFLIFSGYAALFSTAAVKVAYARTFRVFQCLFGTVFGAVGAELVWVGAKEVVG